MVRIIVTVVLVVLIAVLVWMNVPFKTTVSLFGAQYTDVPVVAVAALSFALGIVYSLFIFFTRYLRRRAKNSIDTRRRAISERERLVAEKEAAAARGAGDAKSAPTGSEQPQEQSRVARLFRKRTGNG